MGDWDFTISLGEFSLRVCSLWSCSGEDVRDRDDESYISADDRVSTGGGLLLAALAGFFGEGMILSELTSTVGGELGCGVSICVTNAVVLHCAPRKQSREKSVTGIITETQ